MYEPKQPIYCSYSYAIYEYLRVHLYVQGTHLAEESRFRVRVKFCLKQLILSLSPLEALVLLIRTKDSINISIFLIQVYNIFDYLVAYYRG